MKILSNDYSELRVRDVGRGTAANLSLRRAAFAALTPPPTDKLVSASACGSDWSLGAIGRRTMREKRVLTQRDHRRYMGAPNDQIMPRIRPRHVQILYIFVVYGLFVLLTGCDIRKAEFEKTLKKELSIETIEKKMGSPYRKYTPDELEEFGYTFPVSLPRSKRDGQDTDFVRFTPWVKNISIGDVHRKIRDTTTEIWIYHYRDKNIAFESEGLVFILIDADKKISDWEFIRTEFKRGILIMEKNIEGKS